MRIVAFTTDAPTMRDLPAHLGDPTAPPMIAPARGPPMWEAAAAEPMDPRPPAVPSAQPNRPAIEQPVLSAELERSRARLRFRYEAPVDAIRLPLCFENELTRLFDDVELPSHVDAVP